MTDRQNFKEIHDLGRDSLKPSRMHVLLYSKLLYYGAARIEVQDQVFEQIHDQIQAQPFAMILNEIRSFP